MQYSFIRRLLFHIPVVQTPGVFAGRIVALLAVAAEHLLALLGVLGGKEEPDTPETGVEVVVGLVGQEEFLSPGTGRPSGR